MDASGSEPQNNSGSGDNAISFGNSGTDNVYYIDYYQRELKLAKDAQRSLSKDPVNLTEDE